MKWYFVLNDQNRAHVQRSVAEALRVAPVGYVVRITEPTRNLSQNAAMWAMLADISAQVKWDGETMTSEEWKDWFTAALNKQRMVRGMEGGIVFVGSSTSKMGKYKFSDLLELIASFGAQSGVKFSA